MFRADIHMAEDPEQIRELAEKLGDRYGLMYEEDFELLFAGQWAAVGIRCHTPAAARLVLAYC